MLQSDQMFAKLYHNFWAQREVLQDAPALTQESADENTLPTDMQLATQELKKLVSHLLGGIDMDKADFNTILSIVTKYYTKQPEWEKLLIDYLKYTVQLEAEANDREEEKLAAEAYEIIKKERPELLEELDKEE